MNTGEVLLEANDAFVQTHLEMFLANNVDEFTVCFPDNDATGKVFSETLSKDHTEDCEEAAKELFKKIRPGEPATLESSKKLLFAMFFDNQKYDLSKVGRHKMNAKLGLTTDLEARTLSAEDFVATVHYLLRLKKYDTTRSERVGRGGAGAQGRHRPPGQPPGAVAWANCWRTASGSAWCGVQRAIKEKFSMAQDPNSPLQPHDLINSKPVIAAMKEFFGSSQLSQFMDQNNPLSEITHKRRLSALGPGGLSRDRAGFEVRDVHTSHYGRICPIETPEGPNIGLISLPVLLRPHQRVRLHREPLPEGGERPDHQLRQGHQRGRLQVRLHAGGPPGRAGSGEQEAGEGRQAPRQVPRCTPGTCPPGRRTSTSSPRPTCRVDEDGVIQDEYVTARVAGRDQDRGARRRSPSWTSAPSSWCPWPPASSPSWRTTTPTGP